MLKKCPKCGGGYIVVIDKLVMRGSLICFDSKLKIPKKRAKCFTEGCDQLFWWYPMKNIITGRSK